MGNFYKTSFLTLAAVLLLGSSNAFAVARTWVGAGAGGGSSDFNTAGNWSPSGIPTSSDDLSITLTSAATVSLSADITVNSISFVVNVGSGTSYGRLDANGNTLTVNGTATFYGVTYSGGDWDIAEIDAGNNSGGFIFKGTTSFQTTGSGDVHFEANVGSPGDIEFQGDVTFGSYAYTTPSDEPDFIFNATTTQSVNCNQVTSYTMGESMYFGTSNSPTITFGGSAPWRLNCYEDDLAIGDNTTLNMLSGALDSYLGGGVFTLGAGSSLRIYGTATFPGDNLSGFNDYGTYNIDPTSTVEYYGSSQNVKGSNLQYGHLILDGSGTKTSVGNFQVKGNWTNNAVFNNGSDTHTFSGTTDQTISGSNAPNFYNLVVNKSSGTLSSSVNFNAINELQMDAGTLLLDGETVEARNAVDINGGTLRITGGSFTMDEDSDTDWNQTGGTVDIDGGTVTLGDLATDANTDYNISGGTLDISAGTLSIADELDQSGGTINISGTAAVNVAAHTGSGTGSAASKLNLSSGTFNMSNGTLSVLGAFNGTSTYPGIDLNATTVNITGGTISASETGSSDESFYIQTRGNAVNDFEIDKTAGAGVSTVDIWHEDFEDLSQGTESDAGATAWTTACTGGGTCGLGDGSSNDYFYVRSTTFMSGNRAYVGRDMDGEAKWTSESINITGYSNVSISIDLNESGGDNGSDYVRAYYSVDGGAETALTNGLQSGNFNGATATASGLSGSTLRVFVYMNNNGGSDYGLFDEVLVQGETSVDVGNVFLAGPLDVNGDFTLSSGTLDVTGSNHVVTVAGNWVNTGGTFEEQNGTVTFDGGSAQALTNASGETFYNVTMDKSANELTLNNNIEVSNTLTLTDGVITTGGNRVYVSNNAAGAVTGYTDASFVFGNLRRAVATNTSTYGFPVGDGTSSSDYYLADVINNNLTGISFIDGSFGPVPGGGTLSLDEEGTSYASIAPEGVWYLDPNTSPSGGDYGVNLYVANFAGLSDNMFMPLKRPSGSTDAADWDCAPCGFGNPGIPTNGSAGRTTASGYSNRLGYTSFSQHGLGISDAPLPIELLSFEAKATEERTVELIWVTESELNNDFFTIERTLDGENFEVVGTVQGAGTTNQHLSYRFVDERPYSGVSYYRLRQTDFDGSSTFTDLRTVEFNGGSIIASVFPNPSNGTELFLDLEGVEMVNGGSVIVRDMAGRVVHQQVVNLNGGNTQRVQLQPEEGLAVGIYTVQAQLGSQQIQERFLVK